MSTTRHRRRPAAIALIAIFLLTVIPALPVAADSTAQALPFSEDWTDTSRIGDDDWSAVPGIVGFLGQDITTATGVDPRTLLADSAVANDVDAIANQVQPNITNGGVGIGYSQHAGMVVVADGTPLAAEKLERVLTTDPAMGVLRHVDAGYDRAIEVARERGIVVPMRTGD